MVAEQTGSSLWVWTLLPLVARTLATKVQTPVAVCVCVCVCVE